MTLEEAKRIEELAVTGLTTVIVKLPDIEGEPQESKRYLLTEEALSELATRASVEVVLGEAKSAIDTTPRGSRSNGNGERRDHNVFGGAGFRHKGRTSPEEAEIVRTRLDEVNTYLAAAGERIIDPSNEEHARRYGFGEAVAETADGEESQGDEGAEPEADTGESEQVTETVADEVSARRGRGK